MLMRSSKLITSMSSANWKERNLALEEVEGILQAAGGRIQPSIGDLIPAVKVQPAGTNHLMAACMQALSYCQSSKSQARLTDSNKNLVARALLLLGDLAKALGPAFDRVGRPIVQQSVTFLADNKKQAGHSLALQELGQHMLRGM